MTTNITIQPAGHFIILVTTDDYCSPGGLRNFACAEDIIPPQQYGGKPMTVYSTTTRTILVKDLEETDVRVLEWKKNHGVKIKPVDDHPGLRDATRELSERGAPTRELRANAPRRVEEDPPGYRSSLKDIQEFDPPIPAEKGEGLRVERLGDLGELRKRSSY